MKLLRHLGALCSIRVASTIRSMITATPIVSSSSISYIDFETAKSIDEHLMSKPGFSIDQLMELAGLSVAEAAVDLIHSQDYRVESKEVLVFCGPGNNGGDGLVASRHLKHFGFNPTVVYPRQQNGILFENLVFQNQDLGIPILSDTEFFEKVSDFESSVLIIDAIFGFSFHGMARPPFDRLVSFMAHSKIPVLSVDIPSGWSVEHGDVHETGLIPAAVVSLTAPKKCMQSYTGVHYVGGRFISQKTAQKFGLLLPSFGENSAQIVRLAPCSEATCAPSLSSETKPSPPMSTDAGSAAVLFATASSVEEAKTISAALLRHKAAACINIIPSVTSVYEWQGKVEESSEVMLVIKTRRSLVDLVTRVVKESHSYTVPETIAMSIIGGNQDYLKWVQDMTTERPDVAEK